MKNLTTNLKQLSGRCALFCAILAIILMGAPFAFAAGPAIVNLGTAGDFVALAKTTITTTGVTSIVGDIGISPAAASFITGFGLIADPSNTFSTSSLLTGKIYAANYAAPTPANMTTAISDMQTAYTDAAGRAIPDFTELGAGNISGMNLIPGLYKWGTGLLIDNTGVTLTGGPNDVWIFQIAGTLTLNSGAIVTLAGGAQAKNIFWQVAGQTTLNSTVQFKGVILDQTAIVMKSGATLTGRALAQTAVTLIGNDLTDPDLIVGAATKLAFGVQPGNTIAAESISPAVTVRILDASGILMSSDTRNVTLAISANPGGGILSGTTTVAAIGGIATFNTLSINKSGAGYTLAASSAGLTGAISNTFDINAGVPTKLAFGVQPINTSGGVIITPAITARILDANDNLAISETSNVTLAISANPGGGTLSGTTTVAAIGGIATFNTLSINKSGAGYSLAASSAGLTGVISNTFDINPGVAAKLAFGVQPINTSGGVIITPAITARILDANDNLAISQTSDVTIAIAANPSGGTLSGTMTITAIGGIATFNNLSINTVGTGYTLSAASPSLTGATSNTFNIIAGAATKLAFGVQPGNAKSGETIHAVTVRILDAGNNLVLSDSRNVTLSIGANPGNGTLSGISSISAIGGVATFSDLSIDKSGRGYTLIAVCSPVLTGVTSTTFEIYAGAPAKLDFAVHPGNASPGVIISPSVTVGILDANNHLVTTDTRNVTIAIAANPGNGTLSGTTTVRASGGVAVFNDLSLNATGTGYTLIAESDLLTSVTSNTFNIYAGQVTKVLIETAADGSGTGIPSMNIVSGNSITVYAISRDVNNNFVDNVQADSWLFADKTGGVTPGDLVQSEDKKSAVFTGHVIGTTKIKAVSGTLASVNSGTISITPGAPVKLAFGVHPSNTAPGIKIIPAVTVGILDASNNLVMSNTRNVTLAIASNPSGGILSGTTTVSATGGIAIFNNISINATGIEYTLSASSSPVLTGAISNTFDITAGQMTKVLIETAADGSGDGIPALNLASGDSITLYAITRDVNNNYVGNVSADSWVFADITGGIVASDLVQSEDKKSAVLIGTVIGTAMVKANSGELSSVNTGIITVIPGEPAKLGFGVHPSNTAANVKITPDVTVEVLDINNNLVTSDTRNVSVSIASNPGSGLLSGTKIIAVSGGIAIFSTLSINSTGIGFTLRAESSPALTGAISNMFDVVSGATFIEKELAPNEFTLSQNYPNPFNPSTTIQYSIVKAGIVSLKVYNVVGQEVAILVNGHQEAGNYSVTFNTNDGLISLSNGVYFYRLEAGSFVSMKKFVFMK